MRKSVIGLGIGLPLVLAAGLLTSQAMGQGGSAFGAAAVNDKRQAEADKEPGGGIL